MAWTLPCGSPRHRTRDYRAGAPVRALVVHGHVGGIQVSGGAGDVDLASISGPVEVTGQAGQILGRDISATRAAVRLSAGRIDITFSAAPATLTAASAAGSVTLRVPGGVSYAVHASTTVGRTQVSVPTTAASSHVITATVTTGAVTVEPAP